MYNNVVPGPSSRLATASVLARGRKRRVHRRSCWGESSRRHRRAADGQHPCATVTPLESRAYCVTLKQRRRLWQRTGPGSLVGDGCVGIRKTSASTGRVFSIQIQLWRFDRWGAMLLGESSRPCHRRSLCVLRTDRYRSSCTC